MKQVQYFTRLSAKQIAAVLALYLITFITRHESFINHVPSNGTNFRYDQLLIDFVFL